MSSLTPEQIAALAEWGMLPEALGASVQMPGQQTFVSFNSGASVVVIPLHTICRVEQHPDAGFLSLFTGNGGMDSAHWPVPIRQVAHVLYVLRAAGWPIAETESVDE